MRGTPESAVGPVMAAAGEAASAQAHTINRAVVLDFVNPERAGRRLGCLRRQARLDEAGWITAATRPCRRVEMSDTDLRFAELVKIIERMTKVIEKEMPEIQLMVAMGLLLTVAMTRTG